MVDEKLELLDIRALAALLHCSNATAYKLTRTGTIRCGRVGNRYRITRSEVDAFLRGGVSGDKSGESISQKAT